MRLAAPARAPALDLVDIHGQPVSIGKASGRRTLLCFFRDAACPFCNYRAYELTHHHAALQKLGLDIVAVFASDVAAVKRFVARNPRPFPVIADPELRAYAAYGVEQSLWGKLKAIATRLPTLIRGLRMVGPAGLNTNNFMPVDFLIDEDGRIVESHYARDAGDHIPFERIELFVARGMLNRAGG